MQFWCVSVCVCLSDVTYYRNTGCANVSTEALLRQDLLSIEVDRNLSVVRFPYNGLRPAYIYVCMYHMEQLFVG